MKVFISYSHQDEPWKDRLLTHLGVLAQDGALEVWDDRRIAPGKDWQREIAAALHDADIALLLISADFLTSSFLLSEEVPRLLERRADEGVRVVPLILRPCAWDRVSWLKPIQAWPPDGRALSQGDDAQVEEDLAALAREIDDLRKEQRSAELTPSYPDERVRHLSEALDDAYRRQEELAAAGGDASAVREEILDLRRKIREGGQLQPGDFLLDGRFRLISEIGHGGFATVWKAFDKKSRRTVAVKALHGQYGKDKTRRERFFRGARQMARLHHHGIVQVIEEQCEDGGYHFFVMEHVDGTDLRRAVREQGLGRDDALRIVLAVGEALAFAHESGVVHRDVKPGNVLLDRAGRPKLTDFDLVRAVDTTGGTRTGMLGTVIFAAPEVMHKAKEADSRADVFGLGMTAVFALHGDDLPLEVLRDASGFVDELGVTTACRKALARAVAWKAEDRWAGTAEFCAALEKVLAGAEPVVLTREPFTESVTETRFLWIPGGRFRMGSDRWEALGVQ